MPNLAPFARQNSIGYCTNVHAGTTLESICSRLSEFAVPLAHKLPANESLGVGLWLPKSASDELASDTDVEALGDWLRAHRLHAFTMNGFPYDNFHRPVVKHDVYVPTWADTSRFEYTLRLAQILATLHRPTTGNDSSAALYTISTLPVGWPSDESSDQQILAQAGKRLRDLAAKLQRLEKDTGVRVIVAIEPEPGCLFDTCDDLVTFFETELPDALHRRYLGVCHDVCHSAVMFEDQATALRRYADSGVTVGKVQVSSAIDLPLRKLTHEQRAVALQQLHGFAEDRYLHQTGVINAAGQFELIEDLPQWLAVEQDRSDQHLRIHFHVPIFLEAMDALGTTRSDIEACVEYLHRPDAPEFTGHWEVETYAWTVMPQQYRLDGLSADLERELTWFKRLLSRSEKCE